MPLKALNCPLNTIQKSRVAGIKDIIQPLLLFLKTSITHVSWLNFVLRFFLNRHLSNFLAGVTSQLKLKPLTTCFLTISRFHLDRVMHLEGEKKINQLLTILVSLVSRAPVTMRVLCLIITRVSYVPIFKHFMAPCLVSLP